MAILLFAEIGDLDEYFDETPANARDLIMYASLMISDFIAGDVYPHTATGLPTNPKLIEALNTAVCLQAKYWDRAKIDPSVGDAELGKQVASQSVTGGSVSYDNSAATKIRAEALKEPCSAAKTVLRLEGLGSKAVGYT